MQNSLLKLTALAGVIGIGFLVVLQTQRGLSRPAEEPAEEPTEEMMEEPTEEVMEEPGTLLETASANSDFSVLVMLIGAAGLEDTISGDGLYTVFAPTEDAINSAFDEFGMSAVFVSADS